MTHSDEARVRPGRPAKAPGERKRNQVKFRLTDEANEWLRARASAAGRSMSEEVEFILYHVRYSNALAGEFSRWLAPLLNGMSARIGAATEAVAVLAKQRPYIHVAAGSPVAGPQAPQTSGDDVVRWLSYEDLKAAGIVANRTTLARWIERHDFPKPTALGPNTKRWRETEIRAWQKARTDGSAARS